MGAYFQGGLTFQLTFPSDMYLRGVYCQWRVEIIELENKQGCKKNQWKVPSTNCEHKLFIFTINIPAKFKITRGLILRGKRPARHTGAYFQRGLIFEGGLLFRVYSISLSRFVVAPRHMLPTLTWEGSGCLMATPTWDKLIFIVI